VGPALQAEAPTPRFQFGSLDASGKISLAASQERRVSASFSPPRANSVPSACPTGAPTADHREPGREIEGESNKCCDGTKP